MQASIKYDEGLIRRDAAMIVIANATRYGSGAVINPLGKLTDNLFEIVVVRKLSFTEIFKMMVTHAKFDRSKTELLQAQMLDIVSRKKVHFQVDGEYLGKVNKIHAEIIPDALSVVL